MERECVHLKLWYFSCSFVVEHSRSIIYIASFLTFRRTICWSFDEVGLSQIPGHDSGQETSMETKHHRQIEATQS